MSKIIGIDLGTTNSVGAVMMGNEPVVIPSSEGERLVPSVVAVNKNHERLVGRVARNQAIINAQNTVFSIKRFMGRKYEDPEVQRTLPRIPYTALPAENGDVRVRLDDKEYSPPEISAMILAKIKRDAEAYLSEPITQAVITVPAYFNDAQRNATKDAGKIAGLDVLRIINEPTASSLAYGLDKKKNEIIAVYDLGGGTFDISILDVGEGVFQVRSTNGNTFLGGDDFDQRIMDYFIQEFQKETGIDLRQDRQALQRLREAAEKAKIELSTMMETEVSLPFITADANGPKHLQVKITRAKFEQLSASLVQRLRGPFEQALRDSKLTPREIDEVVLVGGATRMPMVQTLVRELTGGKEPNKSVNPDEVVAIGAAIQAGVLGGEVKDVLLLDVTPLSLGLETLGGVMTTLIPRNTTVPYKKSEVFSTADDNQTAVDVHVLQGERPLAADNMTLGRFRLEGIPPAPRGLPQVEVTFDIDANGILHVAAKDKATGKEQQITITASTNLSKQDIDRMVDEAQRNASQDNRHREVIQARNEADTIIYQAEKSLRDLGDKVAQADRARVETKIAELKSAMASENVQQIRSLIGELQQATLAIGQNMYQGYSGGSTGPQGEQGHGQPDGGDVVEGEYRQV